MKYYNQLEKSFSVSILLFGVGLHAFWFSDVFGCDKCHRVYGSEQELHEHKLKVHGFACPVCKQLFLGEEEMMEHARANHGLFMSFCHVSLKLCHMKIKKSSDLIMDSIFPMKDVLIISFEQLLRKLELNAHFLFGIISSCELMSG